MRKAELLEKLNKLQKQLDNVTNVVDLMARIEHARQDKIKEKKYLYVYADGDFFIHSQSPIGAPAHWQYFGKIKLEVQDD